MLRRTRQSGGPSASVDGKINTLTDLPAEDKAGKRDLAAFLNTGRIGANFGLPHLFDRFYRADKARTKLDSDSAGLGLSITKAIMRAHQGEVSVQSTQGKTRFTLLFPNAAV
jgi:hypothetical protein